MMASPTPPTVSRPVQFLQAGPSESDLLDSQALMDQGLRLYKLGRYRDAEKWFEAARKVSVDTGSE